MPDTATTPPSTRHRRPPRAAAAWLIAAAHLLGGCVTSAYAPRRSPFIKTVVVDSALKYRVEGRDYDAGPFGDLPRAVAAVPEAQRHAERAADDGAAGLALVLGGSLAMGAGTAMVISDVATEAGSEEPSAGPDTLGYVGLGLMIVGLAATTGGALLMMDSQVHQLDAINIFNDAMWAQYLEGRGAADAPLPRAAPPR